uniref:Neprosin PEP catalytic domain-containing protein n=1 Tax=Cajanus cajan TaxID=3821 RepID=A0A151U165_CAJCA|nr:hypothetical protein KK1_005665 [Cajanus cajan]
MNTLFFVLCLVATGASHLVHGIQNTHKEDQELERQLKLLNKPPVKSIHTKFGYIVDCIDINKQPTFDYPLLKNHKLQKKPFHQKSRRKTNVTSSQTRSIFGLHKVQCPTGAVPIRRITKDDLIRNKLLLKNHVMTKEAPGYHYAQASLTPLAGPYYGVSGQNSVYNPKVQRKDQISASHLWVQNGPIHAVNKITFGWQVDPQLYGGDEGTYVYARWNGGCFNILCPGFVQIHKGYYLGALVTDTSIYGGTMVEYNLAIYQEQRTKDWWLRMGNENIGYFPAKLFTTMFSANIVGWGGSTRTPPGSPSPQMGSGYFPDDNFVHACYFRHVGFQNTSRQYYGPPKYTVNTYNDNPNCFGVEYYGDQKREVGYSLQFGGPGGNCGN